MELVLVPVDVTEPTEVVLPVEVVDPEVEVEVVVPVVVVDPAPPFTIVNSPDSGNAPVPPFRGSKTTW